MAHRRHGIRANLVANRELRPEYKKRASNEAFGIYRPLTEESADAVWEVLVDAKHDVNRFFTKRRNSSAELVIPDDLGVTFVMKMHVRRALKKGMLQRGFELHRMLDSMNAYTGSVEDTLAVPLAATDWYSQRERKLVYEFEESEATEKLAVQSGDLEELLESCKAGEVRVFRPDHFTLFKYGQNGDGRDLSQEHKNIVGEIVQERFEDAKIGAIVLGGLIPGESYSQPIWADQQVLRMPQGLAA